MPQHALEQIRAILAYKNAPLLKDFEDMLSNYRHTHAKNIQMYQMLNSTGHGTWVWDLKRNKVHWDSLVHKHFGIPDNEFDGNGNSFLQLIAPEDQKRVAQEFKQIKPNHFTTNIEYKVIWPDKSEHYLSSIGVFEVDEFGNPSKIHGVTAEITDYKQDQQRIINTTDEFHTLADLVPVGVFQVEPCGECIYSNDQWLRITKSKLQDIVGKKWFDNIEIQDREAIKERWHKAVKSYNNFNEKVKFLLHGGEVKWIQITAEPLPPEPDVLPSYMLIGQDITHEVEQEENIEELANHDFLTGLGNRMLFLDRLNMAFLRSIRTGSNVVLFIIDLDGFKIINETLGSDIGDKLLIAVADRLSGHVRMTDTVARLGSDEFAILLDGVTDPSSIAVSAKKIVDALHDPFHIHGQEIFVTASIGIAVNSKDLADSKELLTQADIAVNLAKNKGKNNFQYYTDELNNEIHKKMTIGNKLYRGLQDEEFDLLYQPQIDFSNNKVIGCEALIRWNNSELGIVSPVDFIPLAEENGLIIPITEWVLNRACQQIRKWDLRGGYLSKIHISVNISAHHFHDGSLVDMIDHMMEKNGINPERIVIEITEGAFIMDQHETKQVLNLLKTTGINIALDDFGTGYSSLSYLKEYPIDILKIDQSFIRNIMVEENDAEITSAIIAMAKSLNLITVGEGVETPSIAAFLKAKGCDIGQGYLYSKPISADDFLNIPERFN